MTFREKKYVYRFKQEYVYMFFMCYKISNCKNEICICWKLNMCKSKTAVDNMHVSHSCISRSHHGKLVIALVLSSCLLSFFTFFLIAYLLISCYHVNIRLSTIFLNDNQSYSYFYHISNQFKLLLTTKLMNLPSKR